MITIQVKDGETIRIEVERAEFGKIHPEPDLDYKRRSAEWKSIADRAADDALRLHKAAGALLEAHDERTRYPCEQTERQLNAAWGELRKVVKET